MLDQEFEKEEDNNKYSNLSLTTAGISILIFCFLFFNPIPYDGNLIFIILYVIAVLLPLFGVVLIVLSFLKKEEWNSKKLLGIGLNILLIMLFILFYFFGTMTDIELN